MKETPEYEINYLEGQGELVEKVNRFLDHLKTLGKRERTLYTYGKDMEIFLEHFGSDKSIKKITKPLMGSFLKCEGIMKTTSGRTKSNITITKTRRVVSQFLDWLVANHNLESSPMPKQS
jgi:site-specific recombinase XerC